MRTRSGAFPWLLASAPVVLCGLGSAGMLWAGDERLLAIHIALPTALLVGGAGVTGAAMLGLTGRSIRARRAKAEAAALATADAEGSRRERENHRRFLARLDHELKNPITAIRATVVAAGDDSPAWQTVDAQAQKLSTLVRDLRKLAELETRPLEREAVNLEQLIVEAITDITQQHPDAGARMSLQVTRVPWPVPQVPADPDLLSLALDNVLGNAVKYSAMGPIEIRLHEQNGWAMIEVADSGRGIPADDLPHVFAELARAQNARDVAGAGLGLTLVSAVMNRHGGDVSIRSLVDAGTVVTLRLPMT